MSGLANKPDWIGVDWGTSHLRAWAMDRGGAAHHFAESDAGMGTLTRDGFEPALLDLIAPWLGPGKTTVIACGMVGSRQGWAEAPYRATPCAVRPNTLTRVTADDLRLDVRIIPGVKQVRPADVIRGEETQIAGFVTRNPGYDGIICLPGTHSKWVHVSAGEIISFRTYLTGELFALLSKSSVLRHSVSAEGWDADAFVDALGETLSKPESLSSDLFAIRANSLLHGRSGATSRARLSGLLIGTELAAARPYWLGQSVAIIGEPALSRIYATALNAQGVTPILAEGPAMTLAGLNAAYATLKDMT